MIETYNQSRGTGKTTRVIELMEKDEKIICIVPNVIQKGLYPKHLQDRIISYRSDYIQVQLAGKNVTRVVLDEGFAYREDKLAEIYYYLGYHRIDVMAFGTV